MVSLRAYAWYVPWFGALLAIGCGDPIDDPENPGGGEIEIVTDEPGSTRVVAYDCGAVSAAAVVEVTPDGFAPERATIRKDDIVEWRNRRESIVTVTSGDESTSGTVFDSGDIPPAASRCFEFRMAGTFHYYGRHHGSDHLSGVVEVEPEWR